MENLEWVNKHTIIVNGWLFDFEKMQARRVSSSNMWHMNKGHLHWDEKRKCVSISRYINSERGSYNYDGNFYSMFTPPEDHFNAVINNAYVSYCLEKELINV